MAKFEGFSARTRFTAVHNAFFSRLLPEITDITELKATLFIFYLLYGKRGYPRFVSHKELTGNKGLMSSLKNQEESPQESLRNALEKAVQRGTFLHLSLEQDGKPQDVYFLNTESDKRAVARIKSGEMALSGLKTAEILHPEVATEETPDIFTLYEQNVGMLTPMIAEELIEAEKLYPENWIRDAIKEAVSLNKHSWRYIARILENWSAEGKSDGAYKRDTEKTDPAKYNQQRYGHMVKR
ncbi:MAG: DnaD domain protein [Dehalococcoidales bacterium]|nr:MAG: DnaD domain protein [Dehalococcoidales bacterium]